MQLFQTGAPSSDPALGPSSDPAHSPASSPAAALALGPPPHVCRDTRPHGWMRRLHDPQPRSPAHTHRSSLAYRTGPDRGPEPEAPQHMPPGAAASANLSGGRGSGRCAEGTYLLRASLGLQAGLQSPQQGRAVSGQPFEQPVAVGSLHELLLPRHGHLVRNPIQPKTQETQSSAFDQHVSSWKRKCQ